MYIYAIFMDFLCNTKLRLHLAMFRKWSLVRHRENLLLSNRNSAALNLICFFLLFENFLRKLLNLLISKHSPQPKIIESWIILNIFELIFLVVFLYVKIFSHIFFHLMSRRDFFGYFMKIRAYTRHFFILRNLLWKVNSANSAVFCSQQIFAVSVTGVIKRALNSECLHIYGLIALPINFIG